MMRFRETYENKTQFCDVQYNTLVKDPVSVVRTIYRHYGLTVSDEVRHTRRRGRANPLIHSSTHTVTGPCGHSMCAV
jgi:hypothetical protein